MTASAYRDIVLTLRPFRDTWAECEAHRAKQRIEASGHRANWNECLQSSQALAQELFQPVLSAAENDMPVVRFLGPLVERLEKHDYKIAG
jgi:hypothetical protein